MASKSSSKTKKKSSSSTAAKVFKIIGLSLLVIILLAIIFFVIYFASNGFGGSMATFICKVNGKTVLTNQSVSLPSGSTVKVYSFSDYTISIIAADEEDSDFIFTVNGNEYAWSDYASEDMTAGFELTEDEDGTITITYGTLDEILSDIFGVEVSIAEDVEGEIFELVVKSGSSSLHLPFEIDYTAPTEPTIVLDPDRIIF